MDGAMPRTPDTFLARLKKSIQKNGAPTKISPSGPFCSVGLAEFGKLASLRQSQILNARPWSRPEIFEGDHRQIVQSLCG